MTKDKFTNHLINESSPYLLQHVHNSVDWYPWGDEAFNKAKQDNKLVFLSIGYATCHWCHVMAHESFEDQEVADYLNEHFVSIKVDREERKDLDTIYMKACQAMTGSGGWPLNLWLTPDRLPVYAGTYFPKKTFMDRIGLLEVSKFLSDTYEEKPNVLFNKAFEIITALKRRENHREADLDKDLIEKSYEELAKAYDTDFGGFSAAPKFPVTSQISLMLQSGQSRYVQMAVDTLKAMARGGIYDHIGGGFSRYSVDRYWMIPHFEKMLYDNGLLLGVYAYAYKLTKNNSFKQIIRETIDFLVRDLRHEEGGFYSALDADSEGVEGKFYRFSLDEVKKVLDLDNKYFVKAYNLTEEGNFDGYNVPNLIGKSVDVMQDNKLIDLKKKMFDYRQKRIKPGLDDKVSAFGNGFIIQGLSSVYKYIGEQKSLDLAKEAASYVRKYMLDDKHNLLTSLRHQEGKTLGSLDDYASIISGFLSLYDVSFDQELLHETVAISDVCINKFWDEEHGGFFVGENGNRELIYNPKDVYDGATPSGNSMMAMNLLKLFLLTEDIKYKVLMDEMIHGFTHRYNELKHFSSYSMAFLKAYKEGTHEIKIYIPDTRWFDAAKEYLTQGSDTAFVRFIGVDGNKCIDGQVTIYHCERGECHMPVVLEL